MTLASFVITAGLMFSVGTFLESYQLDNLEGIVLKEIEHCKKPPSFETLYGYIRLRHKWLRRSSLRAVLIRLENKEYIKGLGNDCFCLCDS